MREIYMQRCIDLAKLSDNKVMTNPNVGALLVYQNKIIGEGFHREFGKPHAEINAIESVSKINRYKIPDSTLYVTLEPCSHYGKTLPCSKRIVDEGIKNVVIGCEDPNPLVAGNGISFLKKNGVFVVKSTLEKDCDELISPFKANLKQRPYIVLKWAQSYDNYISRENEQTWLSNKYSRILVHKWRSESDGIMIGINTALIDRPKLDVRYYYGSDPVKIIMDSSLNGKEYYNEIESGSKTIIFNEVKNDRKQNIDFIKTNDTSELNNVLAVLFEKGINTLMVEGGASILTSFINANLWDEARIIKTKIKLGNGIGSPNVTGYLKNRIFLIDDEILTVKNKSW